MLTIHDHELKFLFLSTFLWMNLFHRSTLMALEPKPPTLAMISWSWSSVKPYLSCSLMYRNSSMPSSLLPLMSSKWKALRRPSSV